MIVLYLRIYDIYDIYDSYDCHTEHLAGLTILREQTGLTDTNDPGGFWSNKTYLL